MQEYFSLYFSSVMDIFRQATGWLSEDHVIFLMIIVVAGVIFKKGYRNTYIRRVVLPREILVNPPHWYRENDKDFNDRNFNYRIGG